MKKLTLIFSIFLLIGLQASGQTTDSIVEKLFRYIQYVNNFSNYIPQEKVYLHIDNTSYYQGDNIWFKCYIVTSELHEASSLSKTLYVELLNPDGKIIDKRILKIQNGRCHGDFSLNYLPFHSGFYEIRAYTKYMLNFGEDAIFSRVLPVFDKPKEEGNFEEKKMRRYTASSHPMKREKPKKEKKVNLKFYPEGGNLIQDIPSQVAFEATDEYSSPLNISGAIINETKEEVAKFSVMHDGRGVFTYTPEKNKRKAVIDYNGKKYQFDLPLSLPEGYVLKADNLSYADSIRITVQKNNNTSNDILGLAVICRGKPQSFHIIETIGNEGISFNIDKKKLPFGISRILLFDKAGEILCDRLIFIHKNELLEIKGKAEKDSYEPHELVNMEFSITNEEEKPIPTEFSLSIKDGMNEIEYRNDILTNLLLMSEIKGYIHNPSYYFEPENNNRHAALDLLLMVQGWRRYSWKKMARLESFDLKYRPEQGINTEGQVVSFVRKIPKPNVDISLFLSKRNEDEEGTSFIETLVSDSLGRFAFSSDIEGKWNMILTATEKGKKKDHRIILDRIFNPTPRKYLYSEMQLNISDQNIENNTEDKITDDPDENYEHLLPTLSDSISKAEMNRKVHQLQEVTVTAKKNSKENDIYNNRAKSVAYYDVHSELDDIKDGGKYIGGDIHEFMMNINNNFTIRRLRQDEYLFYKGKLALFVINYERTDHNEMDFNKYKLIRLEAIKSVYINENLSIMCKYADMRFSPLDVDDIYSCAVFIETYPEGMIPTEAGKGVRKTKLDGYSTQKEFYSPDYSTLPPETDYRRTLYWNPSVTTDNEGKAKIQFYNNSRCTKFSISAETILPEGIIGIYKEK